MPFAIYGGLACSACLLLLRACCSLCCCCCCCCQLLLLQLLQLLLLLQNLFLLLLLLPGLHCCSCTLFQSVMSLEWIATRLFLYPLDAQSCYLTLRSGNINMW